MCLALLATGYILVSHYYPANTMNLQINFWHPKQLPGNIEPASARPSIPPASARPSLPPTYPSSSDQEGTISTPYFVITQSALRERLRQNCERLNVTTPLRPRKVYGNELYKILYSTNPKCGSTSFKSYLLRLAGSTLEYSEMKDVHDAEIHKAEYKTLEDIMNSTGLSELEVYSSYNKVGFVRNPLVRVVSAYRDKIERNNGPENMLPHLKAVLRQIPDRKDKFTKFLEMLVTHQFRNEHTDPYWSSMSLCTYPYDMMLQVETINDQLPALQKLLGTEQFSFPLSRVGRGKDQAGSAQVLEYLSHTLDSELLDRVYQFYQWDFELLNYSRLGEEGFPYLRQTISGQ